MHRPAKTIFTSTGRYLTSSTLRVMSSHANVRFQRDSVSHQNSRGQRKFGSSLDGGVKRSSHTEQTAVKSDSAALPVANVSALAHLTDVKFSSLAISSASQRALVEVLGFSYLTEVQHAALPPIMSGVDVMAKAKTGTGKTMGFLIPAVEQLSRNVLPAGCISVLVLSPTRELASQIAKEAESLLTFHPFKSQVIYGGTNITRELKRLQTDRCDVLVATPGRLIDHLQHSDLRQRLSCIQTLILDEADQLLEMGFRPAIEKILAFLPRQRQTLLFSATMPQSVKQVAGLALQQDYKSIDTVREDDSATNIQVKQSYCIVPMEQQLGVILKVLRQHAQQPGHKVIVFLPTARLTQYMAELANTAGLPALEIHSRKSQSAREKASAAFRSAQEAIMFSSDVSARGVDYPDISLVLQVGLPSSREQYIHRLGRTARAGKHGQGILLLAPFEKFFLNKVKDLPFEASTVPELTASEQAEVSKAVMRVASQTGEMAYAAWLGYYNSAKGITWDKPTLVQQANQFAKILGMSEPPALLAKTIGKMGLKGVPGLKVASNQEAANRGGRGGGSRGGHKGAATGGMQSVHNGSTRTDSSHSLGDASRHFSGQGRGGGRGNGRGGRGQGRGDKRPRSQNGAAGNEAQFKRH